MTQEKKKGLSRRWAAIKYKLSRKRINQNILTYTIAVLLATAGWFINKLGSDISAVGTSAVEYYGLPRNRILVPGLTTSELSITFSARGNNLLGTHGRLPGIRIDLSKLDIRTIPESDSSLKFVTNDDIRSQVEQQMPKDFHFVSLKPDTILLDFGASSTKKVPLVINHKITFAKQYRMASAPGISPDSITITGSAALVDTINCVYTETLQLENVKDSSRREKVKILKPNGITCPLTSAIVTLRAEKYTEGSVEVPIKQLNVPENVRLRIFSPKAVIKFNVGWNNYNRVNAEMFGVAVDYNDLNGIAKPHQLTIHLTKAPDNIGVTNITIVPQTVEYLAETIIN